MIKKTIVMIFLICIFSAPCCVQADDILSLDDFDLSESRETLQKSGYDTINYQTILHKIMDGKILDVGKICLKAIYENTIGNVVLIEKTLGNLLLVIILSAFYTNFATVFSKDNISDTAFYICYLVVITIMVTLFESFCSTAAGFVKMLLEFMCGVIPAYFLSVAIIGQISAVGFYQLTLTIIGVAQFVFLNIAIPFIKIYMAISLVNNVSQEDFLSRTAELIKNIISFINKSMVGIVAGLNIIQGLVLRKIRR